MRQIRIPDNELVIDFARSSGPGGQNVNKTSSKAQVRWRVGDSTVLSAEEKERIRKALHARLTQDDEIIVSAESERSQLQNKTAAVARLGQLVNHALIVPKKRRPTRPTYYSRLKRQETKKRTSQIKKLRRVVLE
ncbi:MAG: aminoacyl-tRNA hydrolase [Candidatus Magasanikbacteria bacterium]|nr:aminoacyl-tRNA hydrolase [Candidatus Magasanikbacteria bacterium]